MISLIILKNQTPSSGRVYNNIYKIKTIEVFFTYNNFLQFQFKKIQIYPINWLK